MSDQIRRRVMELFATTKLYCAETVLTILAEAGGRASADLIPLATGFCSGMGRTDGQCGAVSGAIMGIGLYAGRPGPGGDYEPAYALVQEFLARFREQFPSINCAELLDCRLGTPEGQAKFKGEKLGRKCLDYVEFAARTALDILREQGYLDTEDELARSRIAPCGLSCGSCVAYADGPVQRAAGELARHLGDNFAGYAKRFEAMSPVFAKYPEFREMLDFLAAGSCTNCRKEGCLFQACKVTACVREKGVDYCFQCDEFPCDRHGMPGMLADRWKANNVKMREIGPAAWFAGTRDKPRYP